MQSILIDDSHSSQDSAAHCQLFYLHQSFWADGMNHTSLDFTQALYRQLETTQAIVHEPVLSTTKTDFKRFHR